MPPAKTELPPRQRILNAARKLFDQKGFHSTPMSELAAAAEVSVGQIYRFFPGKADIIVAIAGDNIQTTLAEMREIFGAVSAGEQSVTEAIKSIARSAMTLDERGLTFEILAEAYRNPRVAEKLAEFVIPYREGIKQLVSLDLNATPDELEGHADIMMACFFGLGARLLISPAADVECASSQAATLLLRAMEKGTKK